MWFEEQGNLQVKNNELFIAGQSTLELAEKFGTPLYVYNGEKIRNSFKAFKTACEKYSEGNFVVRYAVKANHHKAILSLLKEEGAFLDATSPNEAKLGLKAGFKKEQIMFTGTSVSNPDLKQLIEMDVFINMDSVSQLERLAELKPKNKKISFRWNPGQGAGLHSKTITGGKFIKFGIPENEIVNAVKKAKQLGFEVVGLHQHIGSGWLGKDVDLFLETVNKTIKVAKEIEKITGKQLEFINFGGGPGIKYSESQELFPLEKYVKGIFEEVKKNNVSARIELEPGRSIVGDAGILLVEVNTVEEKNVPVIGVNAGFNTLIRPSFYSAYHEIINCNNVEGKEKKEFLIAGNLCESGDVFNTSKEELRSLPVPKEGNILAILSAGAYASVMASNYNLRERPAEVLILKGEAKLITERETFENLIQNQKTL